MSQITINPNKKAEIDARIPPRDVAAELAALKAALVSKSIVTDKDIETAALEPARASER